MAFASTHVCSRHFGTQPQSYRKVLPSYKPHSWLRFLTATQAQLIFFFDYFRLLWIHGLCWSKNWEMRIWLSRRLLKMPWSDCRNWKQPGPISRNLNIFPCSNHRNESLFIFFKDTSLEFGIFLMLYKLTCICLWKVIAINIQYKIFYWTSLIEVYLILTWIKRMYAWLFRFYAFIWNS